MIKTTIARSAGFAVGAAMVLGFAAPAGAQTIQQLQAQIQALMAQLQALQGGSASAAITSDLTVGSSGSQVVALQNALVAQGYLTLPAGVAPGYFGALTKAAVMKWQAAVGLPATGYFGAMSRAKFAAAPGTTTGGPVVSGPGTGTGTGVITTPGAEGTLTVTTAPVANSTVYEAQDMKEILTFKAEADLSDIALQRVKLDLGTSNTLYRDILSKIYLVDDAGRTLASADLNNSTVVRNGSNEYELTLTGFSSVVAKDKFRVYSIKADIQDSIESGDLGSYTISLSENGVRGIDGAGIDLYSPSADTDVTKTFTVSADLTETASLAVSANAANPLVREVIAAGGSDDNEADKVVLLVFDIKAEDDDVLITDLQNITISKSAGGATASTTYLYAGNGTSGTLLGTSVATSTYANFDNIDYTIPEGTTRTFTIAADIRDANSTQTTISATVTGAQAYVVAENSAGDAVTVSGSASSANLLVRNVGPVFSLVGTPTLTKGSTATIGNSSTSTATATFNLKIEAVGGDIFFGTVASTTAVTTGGGPLASNGTGAPARSFDIYLSGSVSNPAVASSTDYSTPSTAVTTGLTESFKVTEGNSVTLPITFTFQGNLSTGVGITFGNYAVGLERLNWVAAETGPASTTFMDGKTEWRTNSVSMP